MKMTPVESSQIEAVGHDPDTSTLAVRFKGGAIYHYHNVPVSEHSALLSAESIGKHFHANIKGRFGFKRQDD